MSKVSYFHERAVMCSLTLVYPAWAGDSAILHHLLDPGEQVGLILEPKHHHSVEVSSGRGVHDLSTSLLTLQHRRSNQHEHGRFHFHVLMLIA